MALNPNPVAFATRRTALMKKIGDDAIYLLLEVDDNLTYATALGPKAAAELRDNLTKVIDGNIQPGPNAKQ